METIMAIKNPFTIEGSKSSIKSDDPVLRKYEAVRAIILGHLNKSEASRKFNLSREMLYRSLVVFEKQGLQGLLPKKTGPKKARISRNEIEKKVIALKFQFPSLGNEEMAQTLKKEDIPISSRTIARIYNKYGLFGRAQKKKELLSSVLVREPSLVDTSNQVRIGSNRDKQSIARDLENLLRQGIETDCGGGFFLFPYYLSLGLHDKLSFLHHPYYNNGIPPLNKALALLHLALFNKKRIYKATTTRHTLGGLALLSGLVDFPDQSTLQNHLDLAMIDHYRNFQVGCSRRFFELNLFSGKVVNIDFKVSEYSGKAKVQKTSHGTKNKAVKGIKLLCAQDQEYGTPIFLDTQYSGAKPKEIAINLISTVQQVVGKSLNWVVFDRWFSTGELLDYVNQIFKLKFITPLRLHENRLKEINEIPLVPNKTLGKMTKIGFSHTRLRNYEGKVRLIVLDDPDEEQEDKLMGLLTNDKDEEPTIIAIRYRLRWGVENLFSEM
ncbi:MAG: transposase, partial [Candidatus Hydrothermarchaeales archaeon]